MASADTKRRLLVAAAHAYAAAFGRVPPEDRSELESELEGEGPLRTSVTEALWWNSYDDFRRAVREALVQPAAMPEGT